MTPDIQWTFSSIFAVFTGWIINRMKYVLVRSIIGVPKLNSVTQAFHKSHYNILCKDCAKMKSIYHYPKHSTCQLSHSEISCGGFAKETCGDCNSAYIQLEMKQQDLSSLGILEILDKLRAETGCHQAQDSQGSTLFDKPSDVCSDWCSYTRDLNSNSSSHVGDQGTDNLSESLAQHIVDGNDAAVALLVQTSGMSPQSVNPTSIGITVPPSLIPLLTPFCLALLLGRDGLAEFFLEKMFLTTSDIHDLLKNKALKSLLGRRSHIRCLACLLKVFSSPLSLQHLAFVSVSTSLGPAPHRTHRVKHIGLPPALQRRLLYQ